MELEQLKIYTLSLDGMSCTVFRPADPIILSEFVYSAARMGTATLTATVRDYACLDGLWTGREFVALDEASLSGLPAVAGSMEKFFLLHTPSSSKSYDDERYVHTLEFVSERDVTLSNVYFLDAVPTSSYVPDKYRSNQFSFSFFGTLSEFVGRFNSVLALRGLSSRFRVVLDCSSIVVGGSDYVFAGPAQGVYAWEHTSGQSTTTLYTASSAVASGDNAYTNASLSVVGGTISSVTLPSDEVLEVSFDQKTLFDALQDAFRVYKVPFWFEGDIIHFGDGSTVVPEVTFEYGDDDELLTISKNNTNAKLVTRCTGIGGETNIPYYYPNPTPKGTLGVGGTASGVTVANQLRFADKVALDDTITYYGAPFSSSVAGITVDGTAAQLPVSVGPFTAVADGEMITAGATYHIPYTLSISVKIPKAGWWLRVTPGFSDFKSTTTIDWSYASHSVRKYTSTQVVRQMEQDGLMMSVATAKVGSTDVSFHEGTAKNVSRGTDASGATLAPKSIPTSWDFFFDGFQPGEYTLVVTGYFLSSGPPKAMYYPRYVQGTITAKVGVSTAFMTDGDTKTGWISSSGERFGDLSEAGLAISGTPSVNDTITQTVEYKIPPQQNLMPPIYRSSQGADRWYNALNNTYTLPDGGGYYHYDNVYNPLSPREYIQEFEDIYPTIRNLVDGSNNPLNVFDAVYFEAGYNTHDTLGDENNTRKYSYFFAKLKPLGFNIFDCAIENGAMTFEMIDGNCAGCKFALLVDDTNHNRVQVNGSGALVVNDGRVDMDGTPQDVQNDTTSNSVWVCLQIDTTTYGDDDEGVMPGDVIRPVSGDPYVITNIALPQVFFTAAEEKLKHAILEFMAENNAEKYTYSIKFSRVYLAQNKDVRAALNEHASLYLRYAGNTLAAPLHIQQYTVRQQEGEPLPEVDVELTDEIEDSSGGLSEAISASVENIVNVVYGGGVGGGLNTALGDARYLRRDKPETVANPMTFQKGWLTGGFVPGLNGAALTIGDDGKTSIEVDRLVVREDTVLPSTTSTGGGDSLLEIVEYDETNHKYAAKLKFRAYYGSDLVDLDGLFTDGFMSAGGINSQGGGGGGGSTVTWTQYLTSGSKIATISINGVSTDVYAPTGGGGGGGVGTVTSVGLTAGTGLVIGGSTSPITTFGTFTVGIASTHKLPTLSEWSNKQDALTFDNAPTDGSNNPVKSGGIYTAIGNVSSQVSSLQTTLNSVTAIIPDEAYYPGNELADKNFVNSSIATNTGSLITDNGGPFQSVAALEAYSGELNNNDYAFVVSTDSAGNTIYNRYKYNASTQTWGFEYSLNNSSFTAVQWEAINSGITSGLVALIPNSAKQAQWDGKQDTITFNTAYNASTNKAATMADVPAAANDGLFSFNTQVGNVGSIVALFSANQSSNTYITFVQGSNITLTPDPTNKKITIAASYTNTTYKLTVNGQTNGDSTSGTNLGTIYAPTTAGTSGYYLASSGSGAPSWTAKGSIASGNTGLVDGGTVYSALQNYALDNAVVHLSRNETISGDKTFNGNVEVLGWDYLLSTIEGETISDALAAKADASDLADYALDANVVHKTGTESIGGSKTFTSAVKIASATSGLLDLQNTSTNYTMFRMLNTSGSTIASWEWDAGWGLNFTGYNASGTYQGKIGIKTDGTPYYAGSDYVQRTIFHEGNWNTLATLDLPCDGEIGGSENINNLHSSISGSGENGSERFTFYSQIAAYRSGDVVTAGINGFPASNYSNAMLAIDTYNYDGELGLYQLGFSGDGNIYYRYGFGATPFSDGHWNRLVYEDYNGRATITKDIVFPQGGGIWFDTNHNYTTTPYFLRGNPNDGDYSFYIHTGRDANNNPAAMFIECGALYVNGGNMYLQKGRALCLDSWTDAYIGRGGASTDYALYICAGHGSDGTSKVNTHVFTAALCPNATADQSDLGASNYVWNNLYAKRWYPDPANAPTAYIEWDSTNNAFKIVGDVYATGQVAGGGLISNS